VAFGVRIDALHTHARIKALVNGRLTTVHALSCAPSARMLRWRNRKHVALLKQRVAAWNARASVERTYSGLWRQRPGKPPVRWRWRPLPDYLEAENIAGFAPSFTGTTFHSGSGNAGLYVVRYIDFFKKNVGYIPSVKYGDTP
jgi:hypothetical protein